MTLLFFSWGCQQTEEYPDDPVEKAKLIFKKREEAQRHLTRFTRSDGSDFASLQRYSELHGETTKIDPDSCPQCFANYGASLSRIGLYYETLIEAMQKERLRLRPNERAEVDAKIEDYTELVKEAYRQSNRQFEVYFRSESADPRAYEWVLRQSVALGDFDSALFYLDQFVASSRLSPEGEENATILRNRLERGQARQRDADLENELRNDPFLQGLDAEGANAN